MKTLILILFSGWIAHASKASPNPQEFEALMKMDYQTFDQSLPDGGWRGIIDHIEAGKVLDVYHLHNFEKLSPAQRGILYWHAGQIYAMANLTDLALARFKKSYNSEEKPDDDFKWNSYVKGTIAFLEHDKKALLKATDELRAVDKIKPSVNLKFLESFIRCFKKTYSEAYDPVCK